MTVCIVTTRTWPGGWERSKDEAAALKRLRGDWREYVRDYGYAVYDVHPETYIDGMGSFVFPEGHVPQLRKKVGGLKAKA